eukprot:TRINITY_DN73861_c0_g1_i1.p2 TRINITY_DN73861_c0_g1~~TRINITY_DN73861_c0_g1_i1.p2  ORF type:complete len:296 (+),score=67.05 TRINITY_DN73861_c0_g1_i1:303-1190(+)
MASHRSASAGSVATRSASTDSQYPPGSVRRTLPGRPGAGDSPTFSMGPKQWCTKSPVGSNAFLSTTNRFRELKGSGSGYVLPDTTLGRGGNTSCFRSNSQRFTVRKAAGEGDDSLRRTSSKDSVTSSAGRRSNSASQATNNSMVSARSGRNSSWTSTPRFHEPGNSLLASQPGPGAYTATKVDVMGKPTIEGLTEKARLGKHMSPQFASSSARFNQAPVAQTVPAPGAYEIKIVRKDGPAANFGKYGDQRFKIPSDALKKPGSTRYNIKRFGDNPQAPVVTPRGVIAFGSTNTRF